MLRAYQKSSIYLQIRLLFLVLTSNFLAQQIETEHNAIKNYHFHIRLGSLISRYTHSIPELTQKYPARLMVPA